MSVPDKSTGDKPTGNEPTGDAAGGAADGRDAGRVVMAVFAVAVVLAVGAGVWLIGLPSDRRAVRMDDRRVMSLGAMQTGINAYWQRHQRLPETLVVLRADPVFIDRDHLHDPQTGTPYEYRRVRPGDDLGDGDRDAVDAAARAGRAYRICVNFAAGSGSESVVSRQAASRRWRHDAGRFCFDRAVRGDTP